MKSDCVRAPRLETARLVLRAHDGNDLDAIFAMWSHPDVVRHITGKPSTREECWARILRYGGLWPVVGYGYWAVVEKESGRFIGDVGIADFRRDMEPAIYEALGRVWLDLSEIAPEGRAQAILNLEMNGRGRRPGAARIVDFISVPLGVATLHERYADVVDDSARFALMSWFFEEQIAGFKPYLESLVADPEAFQMIGTSGTVTTVGLPIIAVLAPLLGTIADYVAVKKRLLATFMGIGVTAVLLMFFIRQGDLLLASVLFIMANISGAPMRHIVRDTLPFLFAMLAVLALVTFVPEVVLWLPRLLGYQG